MGAPILTIIMLLPLVGAVLAMVVDKDDDTVLKGIGLGTSLVTFIASLAVANGFNPASGMMQMTEHASWIPSLGIFYQVGVDGISIWLLMLTTAMVPIALLGSWNAITKHQREFIIAVFGAGDVDDWRLHQPQRLFVLRLLGGDADPNVPDDRRLW